MGTGIKAVSKRGVRRWKIELREGGARRRRFFATKAAAAAFLDSRANERARYGAFLAELPARERVRLIDALERLDRIGMDLDQAVDLAEQHVQAHPVAPAPSVAGAVAELQEAKRTAGHRPRYLTQLKWSLRHFVRRFEGRRVDSVTAREVETFMAGFDWAPATRRSVLCDLGTLFSFAVRRGWCRHNPVDGVERPRAEDKPPCIFTVEEARRLLETAARIEPDVLAFFALGLFAGLRPAEIERLTWSEIGADHVEVKAAKAKTRRRRLVTVNDTLRAWLALAPRRDASVRPTNFVRKWRRAVRVAGVHWGHDVCRHSFASYHLAAHQSSDKTAFELGHASTAMLFAHYRELVTKADADAWWALRPENGAQSLAMPSPSGPDKCRKALETYLNSFQSDSR